MSVRIQSGRGCHVQQSEMSFHSWCDGSWDRSLMASTTNWWRTGSVLVWFQRALFHMSGVMGRWIDPSWWTHWAISRSRQWSITGVTKAVVHVILYVRWCILKIPCCYSVKATHFVVAAGFCSYLLMVWWVVGSIPHGGPIELFLSHSYCVHTACYSTNFMYTTLVRSILYKLHP